MPKIAKLTVLPLVLALSTGYASITTAASSCDAKRAAIEFQIEQAQKYGNHNKVSGLKRALAEVNTYCTDSGQITDAEKKVTRLEKKLAEKNADIQKIKAELKAARSELASLKG
ncbi:DUF1090 domain-containing protein [Erwinia sp. AnSW2-5]|uniref:DUF1090 domain-containing protein n=1 Tax=Erwinia sp. AnSW2-5 TaxID=3367692 RepID=UPI00385A0E1A